ncbi:hypothetical protein [Nostoc sp. C117]
MDSIATTSEGDLSAIAPHRSTLPSIPHDFRQISSYFPEKRSP